jgi:hypothetical protein
MYRSSPDHLSAVQALATFLVQGHWRFGLECARTSLLRIWCRTKNYSGVAPERCFKISTAILSASRCLSNADISNSIRAIVAINPSSKAGGSLLGLTGNSRCSFEIAAVRVASAAGTGRFRFHAGSTSRVAEAR